MAEVPTTRPSLLLRLRDAGDGGAWTDFEQLYAPLIYHYARKHGLQDADAADVRQEVLRLVAHAIRGFEYDARRGSFRGWLYTVARNQVRKFFERRRPFEQGSGDSAAQQALEEHPAADVADASAWDEEYERRLFTYAAAQIRGDFSDATWQAFWQTAVEGRAAKEIASQLRLTVAAVYLAKSRVMARLKEHIKTLQEG